LDNQAGGSIVAGNDLSIKKNLNSNGSSDNTATNLITNAGTLHANNNQNSIVNTLNSSGDITATNDIVGLNSACMGCGANISEFIAIIDNKIINT
jgi:hypothetical protein